MNIFRKELPVITRRVTNFTCCLMLSCTAAMGSASAHHNAGTVEVCNESIVKTNVAIVSRDSVRNIGTKLFDLLTSNDEVTTSSKGWISRGWYVLKSGECKMILESPNAYEVYFSFKPSVGGYRRNIVMGGEGIEKRNHGSFCVNSKAPYKRSGTLIAQQTCSSEETLAPFPVYLFITADPNDYDRVRRISFK